MNFIFQLGGPFNKKSYKPSTEEVRVAQEKTRNTGRLRRYKLRMMRYLLPIMLTKQA